MGHKVEVTLPDDGERVLLPFASVLHAEALCEFLRFLESDAAALAEFCETLVDSMGTEVH